MSSTPIVIDIETTGLNFTSDTIRGVGVHCADADGLFLQDAPIYHEVIKCYQNQGRPFVLQNFKFDYKFLRRAGIEIECAFDTMLAARLLKDRPQSLSLDSLASYYLGLPSWKGEVDFATSPIEDIAAYCLKDCEVTLKLYEVLRERLRAEGQLEFFETKLMPAARLLAEAEYRGMCVDWTALDALLGALKTEALTLTEQLTALMVHEIREWQAAEIDRQVAASKVKDPAKKRAKLEAAPPSFNWSSPTQVLWLLKYVGADVEVYDPKKRMKVESSNDQVLENNSHKFEFCKLLRDLREREKLMGALDGYKDIKGSDTGRLHCNFNLHVTETGRLSSSSPNLQNVDRGPRVRGLFVPPSGRKLLVADLAQIEVRMAAHYSRDPRLIRMFEEGEDFYGTIAVEILGAECGPNEVKARYPQLRSVAKVIGLSILYGVGPNRLRDGIKRGAGIELGYRESARIIDDYFRKFEGLLDLRRRVEQKLNTEGFVTGLMGRRIYIRPDKFRDGVNYLLQNSASDLMLFRQLEVKEACASSNVDANLVSLVHDELLYDVAPAHAAELVSIVERTLERTDDIGLRVPLKIEAMVGDSWGIK